LPTLEFALTLTTGLLVELETHTLELMHSLEKSGHLSVKKHAPQSSFSHHDLIVLEYDVAEESSLRPAYSCPSVGTNMHHKEFGSFIQEKRRITSLTNDNILEDDV
jgi:hypothetical protein